MAPPNIRGTKGRNAEAGSPQVGPPRAMPASAAGRNPRTWAEASLMAEMGRDGRRVEVRIRSELVPVYLTVEEVATMLHRRTTIIREYMMRPEDPMPFRIFADQERGPLINKDDLNDWWMRNTVIYWESEAAKEATVYKRSSHGQRV